MKTNYETVKRITQDVTHHDHSFKVARALSLRVLSCLEKDKQRNPRIVIAALVIACFSILDAIKNQQKIN